MQFILKLAVVVVALAASWAYADEAAVRSALQQNFAESTIKSISKTPVHGVMEAVVDGRIFYLTDDGRYLLGGPLIDIKANQNLTQAHLDRINAIPFDSLPLDRAIKRVRGNGSRKIAIFEDPDCPYCRKLEQEMRGIDNLTTYVFLYPIEELHPGSSNKSKAIWCAKDRAKAWDDAMRNGAGSAGPANCANPVEKNVAYGREHDINGTPTMILANGHRLVGAVSRAELEQQLASPAK
jgi:thiol:disulfide interchange protein DsbC